MILSKKKKNELKKKSIYSLQEKKNFFLKFFISFYHFLFVFLDNSSNLFVLLVDY